MTKISIPECLHSTTATLSNIVTRNRYSSLSLFNYKLWVVLVACICMLWTGCQNSTGNSTTSSTKQTYSINCQGIPDRDSPFQVILQTRNNDGDLLDNLTLGSAEPIDTFTSSVAISPQSTMVYIYLVDQSNDPVFFTGFDLSTVGTNALSEKYWLDYSEYFVYKVVKYGISSSLVQDFTVNQSRSFDFTNSPYYLLKAPSVLGVTYQLVFQTTTGYTHLWYANDFDSLQKGYLGTNLDSFISPQQFSGNGSSLYFTLQPQSYNVSSAITLSYNDITQTLAQTFDANLVLGINQGGMLFFANTSTLWAGSQISRELRKWDVATGNATLVHTFSSAITCMAVSGSDLYLGVGNTVWRYTEATDTLTQVAAFSYNARDTNNVESLSAVGNSLMAVYTEGVASNSNWTDLVDLPGFQIVDHKNAGAGSKSSAWISSQNRLYVLRDHWSPNRLSYWTVDPVGKNLVSYESNSESGSYTNHAPLIQPGSDLLLLTGSGTAYNVDNLTVNYDSNLGYQLVGATTVNSRLITLEIRSTNSVLVGRDTASPFGNEAILATWQSETPIGLITTTTGVIAVGRSSGIIKAHEISFSTITALQESSTNLMSQTSQNSLRSTNCTWLDAKANRMVK